MSARRPFKERFRLETIMMSRLLPAAGLAFVLAGSVLAQTPPAAGMTLEQFQAAGRSRMLERDADGDGKISAAEYAAGGPRGAKAGQGEGLAQAGAGADMAARMFQRFDANGDGFLDKSEIDAMLQRRFERLDANHDGIDTADERQAAHGRAGGRMRPEQ
jgi:hypothetical protein